MRIICLLLCLCPQTVWASSASLFAPSDGATPLFVATGGGLFEDGGGNLFAPQKRGLAHLGTLPASGIDRALFDVIALAEAGPDGYDAVQRGARIKPPLPPSQMTLAQIFQWIDDTPGQHHAIGRYQIIPSTLRDLVSDLSLAPDTQFNPALQDRLALELVIGAGYTEFLSGRIGRDRFMANLAQVWAGLPLASGKSYYHGKWGNRATIERAKFEEEMERIFTDLGS